jgi:hypothetical protein
MGIGSGSMEALVGLADFEPAAAFLELTGRPCIVF